MVGIDADNYNCHVQYYCQRYPLLFRKSSLRNPMNQCRSMRCRAMMPSKEQYFAIYYFALYYRDLKFAIECFGDSRQSIFCFCCDCFWSKFLFPNALIFIIRTSEISMESWVSLVSIAESYFLKSASAIINFVLPSIQVAPVGGC